MSNVTDTSRHLRRQLSRMLLRMHKTLDSASMANRGLLRRHARVSVFDIALERQLARYLKEFCNDR